MFRELGFCEINEVREVRETAGDSVSRKEESLLPNFAKDLKPSGRLTAKDAKLPLWMLREKTANSRKDEI